MLVFELLGAEQVVSSRRRPINDAVRRTGKALYLLVIDRFTADPCSPNRPKPRGLQNRNPKLHCYLYHRRTRGEWISD